MLVLVYNDAHQLFGTQRLRKHILWHDEIQFDRWRLRGNESSFLRRVIMGFIQLEQSYVPITQASSAQRNRRAQSCFDHLKHLDFLQRWQHRDLQRRKTRRRCSGFDSGRITYLVWGLLDRHGRSAFVYRDHVGKLVGLGICSFHDDGNDVERDGGELI